MLSRFPCKCLACDGHFYLRIVVPKSKTSKYAFPCPCCKIILSGIIVLEYEPIPKLILNPNLFETISGVGPDKPFPKIIVSTELPVKKNTHDLDIDKASPFFNLRALFTDKQFGPWKEAIDQNIDYIEKVQTKLTIITQHVKNNNYSKAGRLIKKWLNEIIVETPKDAHNWSSRFLQTIFITIYPTAELEIVEKTVVKLIKFKLVQNTRYEIIDDFHYSNFRNKLYDVLVRIIQAYDSYATGLLYSFWPNNKINQLNNYRLYRNDFDVIKGLYQDIFELLNQFTFYFGQFSNLFAGRERYSFLNDSKTAKNFLGLKSFKKLQIFEEFPDLNKYVLKISRHWRNSIGHFDATYNIIDGFIYDSKHGKTNYIEFLGRFLEALWAIYFMLYFDENISEHNYNR